MKTAITKTAAIKKIPIKQAIAFFVFALITAAFVLMPFPASDLYIRLYFRDIQDSKCSLYYSTDSAEGFSAQRLVPAEIDYADKHVTFRLDSSLAGHITGLRLDFPSLEQVICVENVTVSSAGVIKRQFDPCRFFLEDHIASSNDVSSVSLVTSRDIAYVATIPDDPYIVFSSGLCQQITDCYSRFRLTRLLVCLFPAACYLIAKLKIFKA